MSLSHSDNSISAALSAWLAALSHSPSPSLPLSKAADNCVALCRVVAEFAPELLSDRDFFVPEKVSASNFSRQRRYNTRRLARSLAVWFDIRPRSPSPNTINAARERGAPPVTLRLEVAENLKVFTDAARSEDMDSEGGVLMLAEVVLCAAVHSDKKEMYINKVLELNAEHQAALAESIKRTSGPTQRDGGILISKNIRDENNLPAPSKVRKDSGSFIEPRGVSLSDYKALAGERDHLRRKLAIFESEKARNLEEQESLRTSLDEAGDRIRELSRKSAVMEKEVESRSKALNEANEALRHAHVSVEEADILREKAAKAEDLEANLKRASAKLEDVADMKRCNKDLENQIEAYRENEQRITKHTDYLEAQLKSSNERAQQLAELSEGMSKGLEEKEQEMVEMERENKDLKKRLEIANRQLESMLLQSTGVPTSEDGTNTQTTSQGNTTVMLRALNIPGSAGALDESSAATPAFNEAVVADQLFNVTGIRMSWEDILECIQGVWDAMNDIERDGQENGSDITFQDEHVTMLPGFVEHGSSKSSLSGHSHTEQSAQGSHNAASENDSGVSVLPEFGALDSELAANRAMQDDEFDYVANHVNVEEIPAEERSGVIRRRSSQLPTIPENREGFTDESDSAGGSIYSSEYTSDMSDGVEDTINATIEQNKPTDLSKYQRSSTLYNGNATSGSGTNDVAMIDQVVAQMRKSHMSKSRNSSMPSNIRRAASLTVSVLSSLRRTPSHSETRSIVRQTRAELRVMQDAVEAMRAERQASSSINALVSQLNELRDELRAAQTLAAQKEAENEGIRKELDVLVKEFDALSIEKRLVEEREDVVLKEKERMVQHLQATLEKKEVELTDAKKETALVRKEIAVLEREHTATAEKLQTAKVIANAQKEELESLKEAMKTKGGVSMQMQDTVEHADVSLGDLSRAREDGIKEMAEAFKHDREANEEFRNEQRQALRSTAKDLKDLKATTAELKKRNRDDRASSQKRQTRFADFWRKLLHRERSNVDCSMPSSSMPRSKKTANKTGR